MICASDLALAIASARACAFAISIFSTVKTRLPTSSAPALRLP